MMSEKNGDGIGFVQRELQRIETALREEQHAERRGQLYAAQQALSWALEPIGFASPYDAITGIRATLADCSDEPHPPSS